VTQQTATETTTDWYENHGIQHVRPADAAGCDSIREAAHPWIVGVAHPRHDCNSALAHGDAPHVCDCGFYWPHEFDAFCSTCGQMKPITQLRAGRGVKATDPLRYTCIDPTHPGDGRSASVGDAAPPRAHTPTPEPAGDATTNLYGALGIVRGLLALAEQAQPDRPPSAAVFARHLAQIKTIIMVAIADVTEAQSHQAADQVVRTLAPAFTRGPAAGRVGHADVW
jgi:hypothetical protein